MTAPRTESVPPGGKSRLKRIVLGLAVAGGCLLLLESLARVGATVMRDLRNPELAASGFAASPVFGWVRRPGFRGVFEETHLREFDPEGFFAVDSRQVADRGTPKVVFIGDSNTFGLDVPTEDSFVEVADRLLPGIDAINLGVSGYSSYQGVLVAEKFIPLLEPAVVVVSFNFNDRRWVPFPEEKDGGGRFQAIYRASPDFPLNALRHRLEYSYLYRLVRGLLGRPPAGSSPAPEISVRLDRVAPRVDPHAYRENLDHIARIAEKHGAKVVFVLLQDDPREIEPIARADQLLADGQYCDAGTVLAEVVHDGKWNSDIARLRLARALAGQGKQDEADAALVQKSPRLVSDGRMPIELDTEYRRMMREVAREHGALCVDAGAVLAEDPSVFIDLCHFNAEGHRKIGALLAEKIAPLLAN